jgi:hypothetical protein
LQLYQEFIPAVCLGIQIKRTQILLQRIHLTFCLLVWQQQQL